MYELKSKMKVGQPFWTVHEGRPFEDRIEKIELTGTLDGDVMQVEEKCYGKELGLVKPENCHATKRHLAVANGWIDAIVRSKKETKEPVVNPPEAPEEVPEEINFPEDVHETIPGEKTKGKKKS